MANELQVSFSIAYNNSGAAFNLSSQKTTDVSANAFINSLMTVTTTESTIDLGPVGSIGYVYIQNLDATNFIQIGPSSGSYFIKLLAGETALFRANASAIYAIADTASCLVQYGIVNS